MKRRHSQIGFCGLVLIMLLCFGTTSAFALDPFPKQAGFSGYIQPAVGYLSIKSNMISSAIGIDFSSERNTSLLEEPGSESSGMVMFPFKLAYTFDGLRTQVFLGTQVEDLARFDMVEQVGIMQDVGGLGVFQAGFLFSAIPTKVWKDPYVLDTPRQETDRTSYGGQLTLDKVFGTDFELQYTVRKIEFDDEKSGQSLVGQSPIFLLPGDTALLDRNGTTHKATIRYNFSIGDKHRWSPEFNYTVEDLDGEAMKNDGYYGQLTYAYVGDPTTVILNAGFGKSEADKRNPIFDKTEKNDIAGASFTIWYKNPWGWQLFGSKPLQLTLTGAYALLDSDIDFYVQEASMVAAGVRAAW